MCLRAGERLALSDAGGHREYVWLEAFAALAALVLVNQHTKLRASALGYLAVLLDRPSVARAKLACAHIDANLVTEDQLLVAAQIGDDLTQPPQLGPGDHLLLDRGSTVLEVAGAGLGRVDRHGPRHRGLNRAPPADGPTAIVDPAFELLLKRVFEVGDGSKRRSPRTRHEFKRCLAVAVFEILPPQPPAIDPQQPIPPCVGYPRHRLRGVGASTVTREPHRGFFRRRQTTRDGVHPGFHDASAL